MLIKTRLLAAFPEVDLEVTLPNGRAVDGVFALDGISCHVEATMLSQSDKDQVDHEAHLTRYREGDRSTPVLSRSTADIRDRVFMKVYDKIAQKFDPRRCVTADNGFNVLAMCFHGGLESTMFSRSSGVLLALEGLTGMRDQVRDGRGHGPVRDLEEWVDRSADYRISKHWLTHEQFAADRIDLLNAPRRLSAILVFCASTLTSKWLNRRAFPANQMTMAQLDTVRDALTFEVAWWRNHDDVELTEEQEPTVKEMLRSMSAQDPWDTSES